VLYGHVFRNAMLIVIAGFPALIVSEFFGGSLIIETLFSLDGLGRLGFEAAVARDYPGGVRHAVRLLAQGARHRHPVGPDLRAGGPPHRLRGRGCCRTTRFPAARAHRHPARPEPMPGQVPRPWTRSATTPPRRRKPARRRWRGCRPSTRGAGQLPPQRGEPFWSLVIFGILFGLSLFAEFLANDAPILVSYRGDLRSPLLSFYSERDFGGDFPTEAAYTDVELRCLIETGAWRTASTSPRR
jgi:hypothetical protein